MRGRRERRGAAALEFAIAAPIVFLVLFGIIEYGRYFMVRHIMDGAAREGARFAVVNSSSAVDADVRGVVNGRTQQIQNSFVTSTYAVDVFWLNGATKTYPFNNATFGSMMGVTVSGTFRPMVPRLLNMSTAIPITSACFMLSEAN